jgi:catechol 2,3-dioxygenase-like lactoylglutathione lyase family enzyme
MNAQNNKGIPGNRGVEHIGITVPDLKEAIDFFENIIGAEFLYEIGPFASEDDWMKVHLNVHPRAKINKAVMLKLATGANLELFEYEAPYQVKEQPKNSDYGGHHITLYVDNMDNAVEYLKSKGIQINGEPMIMTEGPNAGITWVYFLTPWGLQMELVSYENGQAYEKTTSERAFTPEKLK